MARKRKSDVLMEGIREEEERSGKKVARKLSFVR